MPNMKKIFNPTRSFINNDGDSENYEEVRLPTGEILKTKYIDNDHQVVSPSKAKEVLKEFIINEFGEYVKGAFNLTCNKIEEMIEFYKKDMTAFAKNKIDEKSEELAEELIGRLIKANISDEMIDDLILKLGEIRKTRGTVYTSPSSIDASRLGSALRM